MADDAKETLHLAIWANEFTILMPHLLKAVKRSVQIIVGSIFPDGNNVESVFTMNKGLVTKDARDRSE